MTLITEFLEPGPLVDGDLSLMLAERFPPDPSRGIVPAYEFSMLVPGSRSRVGRISLRLGTLEVLLMYGGQIGYSVEEAHRGNHYAARSLVLLLPLARAHAFDELWITCNPDNIASRRSCEIAGAELIEIVDLPPGLDMYERGERQKCRYRIAL